MVFQVIDYAESAAIVLFDGILWTNLNWTGCKRVTLRIYLSIHIGLWFVLFVNCILFKSHLQYQIMLFRMFHSLSCWILWNRWFTLDILCFWLSRWSLIQLWVWRSARWHWLQNMPHINLLILHWLFFSTFGSKHVMVVFPPKGSQCFMNGGLQPVRP